MHAPTHTRTRTHARTHHTQDFSLNLCCKFNYIPCRACHISMSDTIQYLLSRQFDKVNFDSNLLEIKCLKMFDSNDIKLFFYS
jgi:hypothetical protein